ncbi:MAG TPA: choline/ethanolamine kinase family protein [Steroidobacter sp.]|jgi:thiamine kinase-like enzyme|nr:choline/ethanolamine kinase family protein [Steroidobacter sp.]
MQSPSPAEIAAAALGESVERIVSVEEIKHGLTNCSWRVRTHVDDVIVRISAAEVGALRIDRESEARILRAVAAAGIGAPVVQCDPAGQALVTRYMGPPWTPEAAAEEVNIRRLADLLRRLHRLEPPAGVRAVDFADAAAGYMATLQAYGAAGELTSDEVRDRARAASNALRKRKNVRLCHNDVHHLNILDAGNLRLIDWEYAGMGEPLFDLASVCVYHAYAGAQRQTLLSVYYNQAIADEESYLAAALWLFEYVRDLWMAVRELV